MDIRAATAGKASKAPCLDFGFQYALIRNKQSKKFGVEYWASTGSNSPSLEMFAMTLIPDFSLYACNLISRNSRIVTIH